MRFKIKKEMKPGFKIALAILIPASVIILTFVLLLASGAISFDKKEIKEEAESVVLEKEDTKMLMKTGMNHLKIGDYEEAETVFKVIMETEPDNEEVVTLCQIMHNYNRAIKRIHSKDYEDARSYFDKIPLEYMDYDIADDVEKLESEIERFERAYEIFEKVRELMSSSDFENAQKTIDLIDKTCLKSADLEMIESYREEIEKFIRDEKEEKVVLSDEKAGDIIRRFCMAYVDAVNAGDFSLVSPYIRGELYNTQKDMVASLHSQGITERFDFLTVQSVQKVTDTLWKVNVSEGETIFYPDAQESEKTYAWVYTVEYIDSDFYLTNIE